jgi:hypothetical protein
MWRGLYVASVNEECGLIDSNFWDDEMHSPIDDPGTVRRGERQKIELIPSRVTLTWQAVAGGCGDVTSVLKASLAQVKAS